ncbi:MAG: ATP-binding protein [Gemmatimonadota bacterium]
MSLHLKIVWLFVGVALLPLLILAAVVRHQTLSSADLAAQAEVAAAARDVAHALEVEARGAEATLRAFAALPDPPWTDSVMSRLVESGGGPQPLGFVHLEVRDSSGAVVAASGPVPERRLCAETGLSALVPVTVPLPGRRQISALYRPGQGVEAHAGRPAWIYGVDGALLAASSCGPDPGLPAEATEGRRIVGVTRDPGNRGGEEVAPMAFGRIESLGWSVLVEGEDSLRTPLARLFRSYWIFVLGLGATAVLAFSMLLRGVTNSVADLTRATERVAEGDLRPWLPTPRDDEVGRLTEAFSTMTDRLREKVTEVDRAGRLAVLGKLSAYLAHEIRNPLSAVKMNLQRLQRWQRAGELPERCARPIQTSLDEVERLSSAVSSILQLAPSTPSTRKVIALHDLVSDAAQLLDHEFQGRGVELRWSLDAIRDRVMVDSGQIKGAILNLMLNALDAQPEGGQLLIQSRLAPADRPGQGPWLEVRFLDRGPGVAPEIRQRIFEPFFSTKEGGSGVGLAVVAQVARDHGGELRLEEPREVSRGAEFVLRLPLAPVVPENPAAPGGPAAPPWSEGGNDAVLAPERESRRS